MQVDIIDVGKPDRPIEQFFKGGVVTHKYQRGLLPIALIEEQPDESFTVIRIQRRCGFIGDDNFRRTDQSTGSGHALLLAYAQFSYRLVDNRFFIHAQLLEQSHGLTLKTGAAAGRPDTSMRGEPTGQGDIFNHGQIGNKVEHLVDNADVVGAKSVPLGTAQSVEMDAVDLDRTAVGRDDAGDQTQQRALAAAAGPLDKNPLCALYLKALNSQNRIAAITP